MTERYWTRDGWYTGPTTSWRVEWYTLDRNKCECDEGFDTDGHCWDMCRGYVEHSERVFTEADAARRAAEILETVDFFHEPRWIKETLVFSYSVRPMYDLYDWESDMNEEYGELDGDGMHPAIAKAEGGAA